MSLWNGRTGPRIRQKRLGSERRWPPTRKKRVSYMDLLPVSWRQLTVKCLQILSLYIFILLYTNFTLCSISIQIVFHAEVKRRNMVDLEKCGVRWRFSSLLTACGDFWFLDEKKRCERRVFFLFPLYFVTGETLYIHNIDCPYKLMFLFCAAHLQTYFSMGWLAALCLLLCLNEIF